MADSAVPHCEATWSRRGHGCSRRPTVWHVVAPGEGLMDMRTGYCTYHALSWVGLRDARLPYVRLVGEARIVARITEALVIREARELVQGERTMA